MASSNPKGKTILCVAQNVLRERCLVTVVLAVAMVAIVSWRREIDVRGVNPYKFWENKVTWSQNADMAVIGDSRILQGISPQAMRKMLVDYRVLNFGFFGTGYSPEYLFAGKNLLDPKSKKKIILLGITPHSLTPEAVKSNGWLFRKKQYQKANIIKRRLGCLDQLVSPLKIKESLDLFKIKREDRQYFSENTPAGWSGVIRPVIPDDALRSYKLAFINNRTGTHIVDEIIDATHKWGREGINVYAFRPPTSSEMVELEDSLSGFDEKSFRNRFEGAGGIWIDVNPSQYSTYDGSHLNRYGAEKLSLELARKISRYQQNRQQAINSRNLPANKSSVNHLADTQNSTGTLLQRQF